MLGSARRSKSVKNKQVLYLVCVVFACMVTVACSQQSPSAPATTAAAEKATAVVSPSVVDAFNSGKLRFEIRGLQNQKKSNGSFTHDAMLVMTGEPEYTKGVYLLLCSVKRLAGGDPENTRTDDDTTLVIIKDGIGRISIYGGFRGSGEKWEPEKIEVRPIAIFNAIALRGEEAQEK